MRPAQTTFVVHGIDRDRTYLLRRPIPSKPTHAEGWNPDQNDFLLRRRLTTYLQFTGY